MSNSSPRIAIVGGGPAGFIAAVLLHKKSIPFTLFERHAVSEEELAMPSGMLDIHPESGIAAIKECGLYEEFLTLTGDCTQADRVADKDGNILYADDGDGGQRPEIARNSLIKLLHSRIPPDSIKWQHLVKASTITSTSGETEIELEFGGGLKYTFDLVIGADGAWSKIRGLVSDVKASYGGIQNFTVTIRNITKNYPHLAEMVGLGSFSALGNRHAVISQRGPQDSARLYFMLSTEDPHFSKNYHELDVNPASRTADFILKDPAFLASWGQKVKELVAVGCSEDTKDRKGKEIETRPLCELPAGFEWQHQSGVTLVGDAAHLTLPSGEGVNLAMLDSLLLVQVIEKAYRNCGTDVSFHKLLEPLLKEFETEMFKRGKEAAEQAQFINGMLYDEDAANKFAGFFHAAMAEHAGASE